MERASPTRRATRFPIWAPPWLLAALAALTVLRLIVASVVPLAPDEGYYWVWSRALAAGYLDHPPMVAIWAHLGTALLGDSPLGIRLLGPLSALIASLMVARAAECFWPGRDAGPRAALLINATLMFGLGAVIMTPDVAVVFFWIMALWAMAELIAANRDADMAAGQGLSAHPRGGAWWLVAGLALGGDFSSKYTAALFPAGIAIWLLLTPWARRWLRRWEPWAGLMLAVLVFAPVLDWNMRHGWASFAMQGGRLATFAPARALEFLGELLGGQILAMTPLVFVMSCLAVWRAARRWREPGSGLLAILTILPAALFIEHALGDRVQGNWPFIVYPSAVLAASGLAVFAWRRAVWLGLAMAVLVVIQASLAPIHLGRADPTLRLLGGWNELARAANQARIANGADYIVSETYDAATLLARALPGVKVIAMDGRYAFIDLPSGTPILRDGIGVLVTLVSRGTQRAPNAEVWSVQADLGVLERRRGGELADQYRISLVRWREGGFAAALLPQPR